MHILAECSCSGLKSLSLQKERRVDTGGQLVSVTEVKNMDLKSYQLDLKPQLHPFPAVWAKERELVIYHHVTNYSKTYPLKNN